MPQYNGSAPSKTAIDAGIHVAFEQEGYVTDDGSNDKAKLRERILDTILASGKVLARSERAEKATTRGTLVATVFPGLPGPESVDEQPDPILAAAVYGAVDKLVWGETRTAAGAPVQRLVGVNMGNGYVLCRTKVGREEIEAVYVTDDIVCIQLDFTKPENESIDRKLANATRNREMLVLRQPHNAAKYARDYDRTLRGALSTANSQLSLAVQSVTHNGTDEGEEGDES
jgi:hypothetical protein